MAIEYDLKNIDAKLLSLKTKEEKLIYLNEYLFSIKKKQAEFVATDSIKLERLKSKTNKDFEKYHAEFERGGLIYFNGNEADEVAYKRLAFDNIPLLRQRLNLENTFKQYEGEILLFEGLIEKIKNEPSESASYQPEHTIKLDSGNIGVDSDFNHLYYEARFNSWNQYLQEQVKDLYERIIAKHSGYKRQIYERLKFALNDWLIYQRREGNFIEPEHRVKLKYNNAKGAEVIYNWICSLSQGENEKPEPSQPTKEYFSTSNPLLNYRKVFWAYETYLLNVQSAIDAYANFDVNFKKWNPNLMNFDTQKPFTETEISAKKKNEYKHMKGNLEDGSANNLSDIESIIHRAKQEIQNLAYSPNPNTPLFLKSTERKLNELISKIDSIDRKNVLDTDLHFTLDINLLAAREFNGWFLNEFSTDQQPQIKNEIESQNHEIKLTFKPEAVQSIVTFLKDFFSIEQQPQLKQILLSGGNSSEPLVFFDNGNRLADAFKQLKENDFITGCGKQELQSWITKNFKFTHNKKVKDFTPDYIEKCISRNYYPCKKPLFKISNGAIKANT